jgi:hypothetical protein
LARWFVLAHEVVAAEGVSLLAKGGAYAHAGLLVNLGVLVLERLDDLEAHWQTKHTNNNNKGEREPRGDE